MYRPLLEETGFSPDEVVEIGFKPVWWLSVGQVNRRQGWKLHVSSRADRTEDLFRQILPLFRAQNTSFKIAASPEIVELIDRGQSGALQVGKLVTIYPADDTEYLRLGNQLVDLLEGHPGPIIEHELRLDPHAPVYTRYGSFAIQPEQTKLGLFVYMIEDGDGELLPDSRSVSLHEVLNLRCPYPSAAEPALDPIIDDRFLIVGTLAEKLTSTVVVSVDLAENEPCVLKIARRHMALDDLSRDAVDRLFHEWTLLKQLQHIPAVPRSIAWYEDEDRAMLAMENIEGLTLEQELAATVSNGEKNLSIAMLTVDLCRIIKEVHAAGIVLVDLTPANIIISPADEMRVIDFGAATQPGNEKLLKYGTNGYTSPRILEGEGPGFDDDLYSLAAIVYRLVTDIELNSVPGHDHLLRSGTMLYRPWDSIVSLLVNATAANCSDTLNEVEDRLLALLQPTVGHPEKLFGKQAEPAILTTSTAGTASGDLVKLVESLGLSLLSLADRSGRSPRMWTSQHPSTRGEQYRDFYMGDSGIAYSLLRIGLVTERLDMLEVAVEAAEMLWLSRDAQRTTLPGLFIGDAGTGLLFLTLGELLGDPGWLERALKISQELAELDFDSPDLIHGTAGRGLFHLWADRYSQDQTHFESACRAARVLIETQERSESGLLWRIPDGYAGLTGATYLGFAHGIAGIGYFLAELAATGRAEWAAPVVHEIADSLSNYAEQQSSGAVDWPDAPGGTPRNGVWCHGSAGISLFYLKAHQATGRTSYVEHAIDAAQSALIHAHRIGPSQCHGLAGLIEVFLELYLETGEQEFLQFAQIVGQHLQSAFVVDSVDGAMICAERQDILTAEFMVGSSGAAAALARLCQPERFGYFLQPPSTAFRAHHLV